MIAMLAVGARAQAAGAPCVAPGPLDAPGVTGWAGPPSDDGSLDDGAVPTYDGDIFTALNVSAAGLPTPFSYTSVTAPYTDMAGCMAFSSPGVTAHTAEHNCLCTSCFSLMQQCDALPGCQAIWKCSADAGCTTADACYLLPGAPCVTVINEWGTGSVSTALDQALNTCGQAANPACPAQ
jgi:hypothetical protein